MNQRSRTRRMHWLVVLSVLLVLVMAPALPALATSSGTWTVRFTGVITAVPTTTGGAWTIAGNTVDVNSATRVLAPHLRRRQPACGRTSRQLLKSPLPIPERGRIPDRAARCSLARAPAGEAVVWQSRHVDRRGPIESRLRPAPKSTAILARLVRRMQGRGWK